jgi:hypothetical protein
MKWTSPSRGCGGSRESASTYHDEVSNVHQHQREGKSMPIVTIGIDLAKSFIGTLKSEFFYLNKFRNLDELEAGIKVNLLLQPRSNQAKITRTEPSPIQDEI